MIKLTIEDLADKVNEILLERCLFEPEMPRDIARAAIIYCSLKQIVTQVLRSSCHRYYEVANNSEAAIEFDDGTVCGVGLIGKIKFTGQIQPAKE